MEFQYACSRTIRSRLDLADAGCATYDDRVSQVQEQTMLDDAGARLELQREFASIGDRAEIAVENQIALVGTILLAVGRLANDILRSQRLEKTRLRGPAEGQHFDGQNMQGAQSRGERA